MLPSKEILELRNESLQVFARHGLLETGSSVDKGICNKGLYIDFENDRNPLVENKKIYNEILGLRKFNAFFHHQLVTDIIEKIFGDSSFVHPRVICHILFPGNAQDSAEPHQDFAPVREGNA